MRLREELKVLQCLEAYGRIGGVGVLEAPDAWTLRLELAMTKKTVSSRLESGQEVNSRTWRKWGHVNWPDRLGLIPQGYEQTRQNLKRAGAWYAYVLWRSDLPHPVPFYVGKGANRRIFQHEKLPRHKNAYRYDVIKKHKRLGLDINYTIAGSFDTEDSALALEIQLIRSIGRRDINEGPLANKCQGGNGPAGYNAPKGGDSAHARPVYADGVRYGALSEAVRALGTSVGHRIKNGWPGYYYEDEGQLEFNQACRIYFQREVHTPKGVFKSRSLAAAAFDICVGTLEDRIKRGWDKFYYTDEGQRPRRDGYSPCVVDGVAYESRAAAAEAIGMTPAMVLTRLSSWNFPTYIDSSGKVEKTEKRKSRVSILVDGNEYNSIRQAALSTGINEETLRSRAESSNHPNVIIPGVEKKQRAFRKCGAEIHIDGLVYFGLAQAARMTGLCKETIKQRVQSPSFPGYSSPEPHLSIKEPSHGRPSLASIEIDGVVYRSILSAHKKTGINRCTIYDRLKSPKWPGYKRIPRERAPL